MYIYKYKQAFNQPRSMKKRVDHIFINFKISCYMFRLVEASIRSEL